MKYHCKYDELVSPDSLKPHPKNRNKHPDDQIKRLAQILEYQGWRYPVKVSKASGFVTSGHGRILAAQFLKEKMVPVNYQEYVSDEQEYADVIADNAIALWSELQIYDITNDLKLLGSDFNFELLGSKTIDELKNIDVINNANENDEWVKGDLGEFEPGTKYIRLIYQFQTEEARTKFVDDNNIIVNNKQCGQWIVNQ